MYTIIWVCNNYFIHFHYIGYFGSVYFFFFLINNHFPNISMIGSVQLLSRVAASQASLSITNSRTQLRLKSTESVMPSSHLILGRSLLFLPPIPPSIRVFSNESTFHMRWAKYWSFSVSIIPSKEIPGLISFRMDWLDLLAVQGLSRVFSNTTVQKHQFFSASAFFTVQLSHPYMTTGKTSLDQTDLSRQSNVSSFEYAIQVVLCNFRELHTHDFT